MKYARVSRLDAPPGGLAAGIDWASADHAVCVVDAAGEVADRFSVAHTAAGLRALVQRLARAGVREAAIERGDGPVVDALLEAGVTVIVITPRQIKNLRSRIVAGQACCGARSPCRTCLRDEEAGLGELAAEEGSTGPTRCYCLGRDASCEAVAGQAHSGVEAHNAPTLLVVNYVAG